MILSKKYNTSIFYFLLFLIFIGSLFIARNPVKASSSWTAVGTEGFSAGATINISMAIHNGVPYVSYSDLENGNKISVMKFDGTNWVSVGPAGFSAGEAFFTFLAFDNGVPYVVYSDVANSWKATVMKFDGTNWVNVGTAGFSAGSALGTSLTFDNGVPYAAYSDVGHGQKATVMKFNGTNWVNVGTPGFSAGMSDSISVVIDNGVPYVAYTDQGNSDKATLMKFDGMNWVDVGAAGFSSGRAYSTSLVIDNMVPYVAYWDVDRMSTAVMKFDGTNWVELYTEELVASSSGSTSLAIYNGVPYIAFQDWGDSNKARVMKLDGTNWVNVGTAGFSSGPAIEISLALDDDVVYVAYVDEGNSFKATVMSALAATPTISTQPSGATVNPGDASPSLSVTASVYGGGTLSYQWYSNSTDSNSGGTAINGATSASYNAPTDTVGDTYYYVVVTDTRNTTTGVKTSTATSNVAAVRVNALVDAMNPFIYSMPSDATVNAGDTSPSLSVAAMVIDGGTLSYQWYSNSTDSNSGGTVINGATSVSYNAPTGTAGKTYYYVVVTNTNNAATGVKTSTATSNAAEVTVNAVIPSSSSESGSSSTPSQPTTPSLQEVDVLVNGKAENAGTATTNKQNGQTAITVSVDQKKLVEKLETEGQGAVVTIPVNTKLDVVVGELNGQIIKNMEEKQAVLRIKTDRATYTLPAQQLDIDSVSDQIGKSVALQDIKVQIEIAEPTADTVKVVENSAKKGSFTIVVPPLNFTLRAIHEGTTVEVSNFNVYVERTIAIPDGVDPNKITTGVVVDPDGTVRHVPTKIVVIDGKYYAKIKSLTNSTYSVIWRPLEFSDVANHWAKDAVNDMGSRMVIDGTGNGMFSPDRDITRAEFAAIIVRGLGLKLESGAAPFSDVKTSDWYSSAINTAYAYHLISGFEDGTFHPNDRITREQAMIFIAKAMTITNLKAKLPAQSTVDTLRPYTDASDAAGWAQSSIADSVQSGIVSGRRSTELAPKDYITRAEVAAIVERLLQKSDLI